MLWRARRKAWLEVSLNCSATYGWGCRGVKELPVFKCACTVSHKIFKSEVTFESIRCAMYEAKNNGSNRVPCYLVAKEQGGAATVQAP